MNTQNPKRVSGKATIKSKSGKRSRSGLPTAAQIEKPMAQVLREIQSLKGEPPKPFPIVGIGASAGGLEAFTQLLQNLPVDTGMGFVLVQHLDPGHQSALTQLLSKVTSMLVKEVTHGVSVAPNHVYVIPPNTCMEIAKGVLKLRPRDNPPGSHRSIDVFFESLAQDQQERAIGIILSGTATDGTQGLEMIKSEGGFTFAQDDSAKYDSMPHSAVAAGCVDLVLSPKEIAKELARIAKHPLIAARRKSSTVLPSSQRVSPTHGLEAPDSGDGEATSLQPDENNDFKKILLLLRNYRGVDFSLYRSNTIQRRITRRMVLNRQDALSEYARFLNGNPKELELLYADVLICVTSFFRNPEAFAALKLKVFPVLLQHQRQDDPVRVWTLGCSTGQEAYSIAMAFTEYCDKIPRAPKLQIFAMDLNESLLEKARNGLYTKSQIADISPERLKRFFVEEQGGYRICKSLRELCVFARQNILSDPPFSRMDLISCRNLLIYVELELQKRILPNFHYALKPGGFLFLGASESIGAFTNLFEPADKKQKIFSKITGPTPAYNLPVSKGHPAEKKSIPTARPVMLPDSSRTELNAQREADRVMVNQYAPPSVLINADGEVLQFRGPTGAFLEPPTGKASFNVLKMARAGLMLPLRTAINEAKKKNSSVRGKNVRLEDNGRTRLVNIEVTPLKNLKERCYLIMFEEVSKAGRLDRSSPSLEQPGGAVRTPRFTSKKEEFSRVTELERELAEARDYAQSLQEQHETTNEELQASNEEGQSSNEELQSIIEELETSKEELESTNEELITVNEEMASRNTELNRLNSDLTNLQTSTKLPIVLLGGDLSIRRFSPEAEKMFNLVAADVGRPFGNVRHNLDMPALETFIADVIASGRERECEVHDKQGHWHFLHARPYMTLDNKVDGAVLVLVDIDAIKESERAVIAALDFAESIIRTARDPFLILDANLRVERANEAFYSTFKVSRTESMGRTVFELDHGSWDIPKLRELLQDILPRKSFFNNFEVTHNFENIGPRTMLLNARTLSETSGQPARILLGIQDISELLHFQGEMRQSELRYRRLFEASRDGVLIIDPEMRKILDANPFMCDLLGYSHDALLGKELFEIGLLKDEEASRTAFEELQEKGFIRYEDLPLETKTGERREVEFISNLYQQGEGKVIQCNIRDVTARKKVEQELAEKARLLDLSNDAILVRDFEGRILYWNHGAEELYGWSRKEALGKVSHSLLQTEFPTPLEQITEELHRNDRWTGELVHTKRNGQRITVLVRKALDRDKHGNPAAVMENITDISERIQAAEALRRVMEFGEAVLTNMGEGLYTLDDQGLVTSMNPAAEKLFGWKLEELRGKKMHDMTHYKHRDGRPFPEEECPGLQVLRHGKILTDHPDVFIRKDGTFFDVVYTPSPLREGDKITGLVVVFRDVSVAKWAEEALLQSGREFRAVFDSAPGLYLVLRPDLTIAAASSAYTAATMTCREAILGKHIFEVLPENPADLDTHGVANLTASFKNVLNTRLPHSMALLKYDVRRPDGIFEQRWWSPLNSPVIGDEGQVLFIIHRVEDVTPFVRERLLAGQLEGFSVPDVLERMKMELFQRAHEIQDANHRLETTVVALREVAEALNLAQAQLMNRAGQLEGLVVERTTELTATNKQLEAFVYTIAHDLRAPLRAMQGYSAMLVEEAGTALSETGRDFAQRISKSSQFMDALLIDLLAFSEIAQQRAVLTSVNLESVVQSTLSRLENEVQKKGARVEIVGPWPAVLAHGPTLGQVLVNLVNNALKFVPPNTLPLVRVRTEGQGQFIRIWVEDNGIGIEPGHKEQIFKLFTRLHGNKFPGTGIGLAIVQKGVERMGGQVGVESTPGEGCRFWFELKKA